MIDFVFNLDTEAAESVSTGAKTIESGVYDVTIDYASIEKSKKGNNTVSLSLMTTDGRYIKVWGMCIDKQWTSGSENFDYPKWMQLALVNGMKTGEQAPFKLTLKDGTTKELTVFKELHGKKFTIAVQRAFGFYNGEETEKNLIHSSYKLGDEQAKKVGERIKDKFDKQWKAAQGNSSIEVEEDTGESLLD